MKTGILMAVSALACAAAIPALAADAGNGMKSQTSMEPGSKAAAEQSTGDVSQDVKKAWEGIKEDTTEAYEDIKATFIGDEKTTETFPVVAIDPRKTASGMIGKPVRNLKGENVATVSDVIIDDTGKAVMIVVADGEFIPMGKKAAFEYDSIVRLSEGGDVIMPLSEEAIDRAAEFSYDRKDGSILVIPENGYSVSRLLDGELVDQEGKSVAQIDDIVFKSGRASHLIVGFNKILGLGGEKAAMNYMEAEMVKNGDGYDFRMSAEQAERFEAYKKSKAR